MDAQTRVRGVQVSLDGVRVEHAVELSMEVRERGQQRLALAEDQVDALLGEVSGW